MTQMQENEKKCYIQIIVLMLSAYSASQLM